MKTIYYIGCSGYFYFHWKAKFYPEDIKPSQFFSYYQSIFDTVEINSTFYNFPKESTIKRMYNTSKEDFVYAVKMNKIITHLKKFDNVDKDLERFYHVVSYLKEKLGVILIQLPPSFKYSEDNLTKIVDALTPYSNFKNAIEFRHSSWWNERTYQMLSDNDLIFVNVDAKSLPQDMIKTTSTGYVRFHGREKWYKYDYAKDELKIKAKEIIMRNFGEVYVYFNNDYNAYAPKNALTFKEIISSLSGKNIKNTA